MMAQYKISPCQITFKLETLIFKDISAKNKKAFWSMHFPKMKKKHFHFLTELGAFSCFHFNLLQFLLHQTLSSNVQLCTTGFYEPIIYSASQFHTMKVVCGVYFIEISFHK